MYINAYWFKKIIDGATKKKRKKKYKNFKIFFFFFFFKKNNLCIYPFTTQIGFNLTVFFDIPAA